jgi:hypothetical protein
MLAKQIFRAGKFIRGFNFQVRFGDLSRAPLQLLRLLVLENTAECNWIARPPDPWDAGLGAGVQQRHMLLQTLKDAIDVRALLFDSLPHIDSAHVCVYRETPEYVREKVITGYLQRKDNASRGFHSLVMRARVLGFHFDLKENVLQVIST